MKKRILYQSKHSFDAHAFEVFHLGSWQPVELIRFEHGTMRLHLEDGGFLTAKKAPFTDFRLRSRKATLSDCTCFLRPGLDISVFLTSQPKENSQEGNPVPAWLDARVSSIERKPHDFGCKCQFFVNLYSADESLGSEIRTLCKEIGTVKLGQISILQKLERYPCEKEHYRWSFSSDCSLLQRTKLLLGKFLSDMSWLLVVSALRQVTFDVRSIEGKIVYQVVNGDHNECLTSTSDNKWLNAINFRVENDTLTSIVVPFAPSNALQMVSYHEPSCTDEYYDVMNVRRSKRRYVQPERYFDEGSLPDFDAGLIQTEPFRWRNGEMSLVAVNPDGLKGQSPKSKSDDPGSDETENENQLGIVPVLSEDDPVACEQDYLQANHSREIGDIVSKYMTINGSPTVNRKNDSSLVGVDDDNWLTNKKTHKRGFYSICSGSRRIYDAKHCRNKSLSTHRYNDMIKRYMKNIVSTVDKEEPNVMEQWKEFRPIQCLQQRQPNVKWSVDEEEISEIDLLWREMELSVASTYLFEENEDSNAGEYPGIVQNSDMGCCQSCQHEYKLDEEIGILCKICGSVCSEIKEVLPSLVQPPPRRSCAMESMISGDNKTDYEEEEHSPTDDDNLNFLSSSVFSEPSLSEAQDNVWALIPDLKNKLRFHQKKAFEFLWKNIAGSLDPSLMEQKARKRGGCVISHTPGAGKTLLIISFLLSYLKLFPGKRPLVLAPKTTLYTWYREIIKWEFPIPVYRIHGCRARMYELSNPTMGNSLGDRKPGRDVMHVLDCLDKIRKWHSHPSILLMGYTSFLALTRENSELLHKKFTCEVLRESPGILILDEGHNPRSTKSRLRKALMKVKTDLRVLLSGTLFQNNFGEYFNTLSLARPMFINEVLRKLDPNFKRKKKGLKQTQFAIENRARKFFVEMVASKISSNKADDRAEGLNMLRSMTARFIDVYEGSSLDTLPGLQCYTLVLKPTKMQQEILVELQKVMSDVNGFPLELELLITLGSIHPWLIKTAACVQKFFTPEEVESLEKHKFEMNKGSKVKFVVSLVHRSIIRKEKVLIFCHNIAPMYLFLEIFEWLYGWRKNEEILLLQGELELFERGRVMEKFEDPFGASRILIASISACAEGISLTAASRVILLDTEWNPSKRKQAIARAFRPGQVRAVYVYQLLVTGTLEENKFGRTTYKEWVSSLIFSEELAEDPSRWQAEKIEDDLLREIVEEDRAKSFHIIKKNEKASNTMIKLKDLDTV